MDERTHLQVVRFLAAALMLAAIVGVAAIAVSGTVAADQHEPENAPTYETFDGGVSFNINLPDRTDHYPGNHPVHADNGNEYPDGYNASIEYFATGEAALTEQGAEDGLWFNFIEVSADWIDYSECDATGNTKVFGIDRGSDNEGTNIDEDLIEHRRGSTLYSGGLIVQFFDWSDIAGDPPYVSPDDAVVAAQGAGSNDGPCLKMTSEPGWYQVQAYANGTIANKCTEEGNAECEPDDKEWRGLTLNSNYIYICECDSEQEAREELGPPPNEESSDPTPTEQPDDEQTPTPTEQPDDEETPTPTATQQPDTQQDDDQGGDQQDGQQDDQQNDQQQDDQQNDQQQDDQQNDQQGGQGDQEAADRDTPTIADGPGFTPVAALIALLAATLLGYRRD